MGSARTAMVERNGRCPTRRCPLPRQLPLLALGLLLAGCATAHRTRTVGRGHAAASLSLGGPLMTNLGAPVPVPVAFLGGRYGLRDDLDVSLDVNLTAPIILGLPLDAKTAVHWAPIQPGLRGQDADRGWSVVGSGSLDWVTDFDTGFRVFPALTATGAYRHRFVAPYLGLTLALNFWAPFERTNPFALSSHVGAEFLLGEHVGLGLELQIMGLSTNLWGSGMDWVNLAEGEAAERKVGALAPMLAFSYDFDTRRSPRGGQP